MSEIEKCQILHPGTKNKKMCVLEHKCNNLVIPYLYPLFPLYTVDGQMIPVGFLAILRHHEAGEVPG